MLYKVTPAMPEVAPKPKISRLPGQPRKKRKTAIYDGDGNEVLITLMCLKCHKMKPLMQFGLRKMADGAVRNQPWCRNCRSGAGTPKAKKAAQLAGDVAALEVHDAPAAANGNGAPPVVAAAPVLAPEPLTKVEMPPAEPVAETPALATDATPRPA